MNMELAHRMSRALGFKDYFDAMDYYEKRMWEV